MSESGAPQARCHRCGATLAPDATWCGRCLEPVVRAFAKPPLDEREPYVGDLRIAAGDTRRPASDGILPPAAPSLRGGPTSLGAITKIVITALYLLLGVALYPLIIALGTVNAAAGSAYAFVCLSLFVLVGALFLYQIWKPTRTR